ncbi:hypothetical protein [Corynebacterium lactis]|uniref:Uncharacterized protein n=1 Tax=Corynebacterium lactis RW2-5 TaxID=1408189 RepID=A0A0K2H3Z3_9CORY|nr:hypothetical protein [Corynebacterium lactis]ALA68441.1 hypothetical protein CLAC_03360 [Corynebacterium lactis RW2-5]
MTTINDLEERINGVEAALNEMKADLADLKEQESEPEKPQGSLFGRWATHPVHGRGIIGSRHSDEDSEVLFAYISEHGRTGAIWVYVRTSDLTIDPATLTTVEDYRNAPVGTIVEDHNGDVYVGDSIGWHTYDGEYDSKEMVGMGTARVIRWGGGRQMTTYLRTRTVDDLDGFIVNHPPVAVLGDAKTLMDTFGDKHHDYHREGETWVRVRPYRMNPDGTPDHDRTQWDNANGQLTKTVEDTRPYHPTAAEHHYVWYEETT